MHATLPTHVLALAPDSIATIGTLSPESLAELWAVFTRCKDSLENGRRLENLSWRLWFDSGRRGPEPPITLAGQNGNLVPEEWSDPEWEETSSSDSEAASSGGEEVGQGDALARSGRPALARKARTTGSTSVSPQNNLPRRPRTTSVPAAAADPSVAAEEPGAVAGRPSLARRGYSREGRPLHVISGNSLQRMIADLQRMPEIPPFGKARSLSDMQASERPVKPPLGSRGSSAPDGLSNSSRHASAPTSPTLPSGELEPASKMRSRRTSSDVSPALSRANTTPVPSTSSVVEPPAPTPALHRRFPSNLAMSAIPPSRRSRPATPASSPPSREGTDIPLTPSETAMLAVADSRNRSDLNLSKRTQSAADLAASFKPASYVKGFEPSPTSLNKASESVCVPASVDARPGPGAIAPPPTPANHAAALAPSPPRNAALSLSPQLHRPATRTPASSLVSPPSKGMPPTPSASTVSAAHSHQSNAPAGPSAMQGTRRKAGAASKKIFFISSPDSDEEHSSRSRSSGMKVVITPPTAKRGAAEQAARASASKPAAATVTSPPPPPPQASTSAAAGTKGADDDDDWASDSDDDSSGWGSEYSTESDEPRQGARNGTRSQAFDAKTAFAKRAPSDLQRTASMATVSGSGSNWGGGPGELKRPGLLSQLFHPDQFIEEPEHSRPSLDSLRRQHQSSPALAMLGRQGSDASVKRMPKTARTKSFLKGKPEHVELESSSEEEDDDDEEAAAQNAALAEAEAQRNAAAALARRQRELEEVVAPPQTPRTTRRAMLATELSESLRRNLLWERQTRNKALGGQPRRPMMPGEQLPPRPASSTNLAQQGAPNAPTPPPGVMRSQTDNPPSALARPNGPSSSSSQAPPPRRSPPATTTVRKEEAPRERHGGTAALPRRHTTGTGLYLQAQLGGRFPGSTRNRNDTTDSDISDSSDDDGGTASPADAFGSSTAGQRVW